MRSSLCCVLSEAGRRSCSWGPSHFVRPGLVIATRKAAGTARLKSKPMTQVLENNFLAAVRATINTIFEFLSQRRPNL